MRWPRTREIWVASLVLTVILVWAGRYFVNPDGISYLDLSDGYKAGDWSTIANAHWSPAYPLLLATLIPKSLRWTSWEPIVVHIINGWLFLLAFATFEVFLNELALTNRNARAALNLDTAAGRFTAHMIFLWCALVLITIRGVTPDMLLAVIGFAIAIYVIRIRSKRATTGTFVVFGVLLGLAALTKSMMLSVSILLLGVLVLYDQRIIFSALTFVIVISPQLAAITTKTGHWNFSDSGSIVYALKVNGISKFSSAPSISESPRAYAFATDKANETYPIWDDPAKWYSRAAIKYDSATQLDALVRNIIVDAGISLKIFVPLLIVFLCRDWTVPLRNKLLVMLSLVVLGGYALLYSEARLIGFWIALGSISLLAGITLDPRLDKIGKRTVYLIAAISGVSFVTYVISQSFSERPDRGLNARDIQSEVAVSLNALGIPPGSKVALIGDESDIYWARLARVQIVAQIPLSDASEYWPLSEGARDDVNRWIGMTGASALVASWTSPATPIEGWTPVRGSRYSIFPLKKQK